MTRISLPILVAAGLLLAGCQSTSSGSTAGTELRDYEARQQAIERIERNAAQDRAGRGP